MALALKRVLGCRQVACGFKHIDVQVQGAAAALFHVKAMTGIEVIINSLNSSAQEAEGLKWWNTDS